MSEELDALLDRLEQLLAEVDGWPEGPRETAFGLLDAVDVLHRFALGRLGEALGDRVQELRAGDPAIGWLFDAYAVGVDARAAAEAALQAVQPYVASHGGAVEVLDVVDGVVHLRLSGSCAGCSGSEATLREGVEQALHEGFPGFAGMVVDEVPAAPHDPPSAGPLLLQISSRPPGR